MAYFADSDSNGNITGFYTDNAEIGHFIPPTAVPITDDKWQDAISNPGKYLVQNGAVVLAPPPSPDTLFAQAQASKINELKLDFANALLQGFPSTADGTARTFGFSPSDAQHWDWIRGMVNSPGCPSVIPAKDIMGTRLKLTPAQAQTLCTDAQNFYLATYNHWDSKEQDVENITLANYQTVQDAINAISAITW